jgi:drug/metabolite transporter (DMT)-like permease
MVWKGRLLAFVAVFFFGAAYLWAKSAMTWLHPFAASEARFGFAGLLLVPFALHAADPVAALRRHWLAYLALGFVGITCFQGFLFAAIQHTSVVNASVIMTLTPVLTALGAAAFLGEALTRRAAAGMAISVFGAMLAVLGDSPGPVGLALM